MGKKFGSKKKNQVLSESDALPILEFKFADALFQMASHPELPIVAVGLSNGYIYCFEYDPKGLAKTLAQNKKNFKLENEKSEGKKKEVYWDVVDVPLKEDFENSNVKLLWKTKRHKGSVRGIAMDPNGESMYSIGTDNIIKKADVKSGKVTKKVHIPNDDHKFSKLVVSGTHPFLLLGDEVGNIYTLNSNTFELLNSIKGIHGGDSINDIFHFAKRSIYKFISAGETTLAYWDCRQDNAKDKDQEDEEKRNVVYSDDQEDEILCGTFLDTEDGETVVCGMGEGVVTIWKPLKNDLEDQMSRIKIAKDESVECIVSTLQDDNCVWCGCSDGKLYKVDIKGSRIAEIRKHNDVDEVQFLDLDCEYRLVSGGMDNLKIWQAQDQNGTNGDLESDVSIDSDSDLDDSDDSGDDSDDSSDDQEMELTGLSREELIAELDKDLVDEEDSEDDVESETTTNKSAKRKGKDTPKQDKKSKKMKKQEKMSYNDNHGIAKFDDL